MSQGITFCSLGEWYKCLVEELGWIIICGLSDNEKGIKGAAGYIGEINMWLDAANKKVVNDEDKLNDLKIMVDHLVLVKQHVKNVFNIVNDSMAGGRKRRGSRK